jgi:CTP synthase (UTP-ammonia lyase)
MTVWPRIAIVGDYDESKETHRATDAEMAAAGAESFWVPTPAAIDIHCSLDEIDGLVISPGSPYVSMDGALAAIRYSRERKVPLVAVCGGSQHVVMEIARNVLGIEDAGHAEVNPRAERLVVTPLACSLAGQRHPVHFVPGSRVATIYGAASAVEPCYCNYGLNPEMEGPLEAVGLHVSGRDEQGNARVLELHNHPFFIATSYVFQVREDHIYRHPLTSAFLDAAGIAGARAA